MEQPPENPLVEVHQTVQETSRLHSNMKPCVWCSAPWKVPFRITICTVSLLKQFNSAAVSLLRKRDVGSDTFLCKWSLRFLLFLQKNGGFVDWSWRRDWPSICQSASPRTRTSTKLCVCGYHPRSQTSEESWVRSRVGFAAGSWQETDGDPPPSRSVRVTQQPDNSGSF